MVNGFGVRGSRFVGFMQLKMTWFTIRKFMCMKEKGSKLGCLNVGYFIKGIVWGGSNWKFDMLLEV